MHYLLFILKFSLQKKHSILACAIYDFLFTFSITIPEKLEYFINKYAEHAHDKWSMEKVKSTFLLKQNQIFYLNPFHL